MCTMRCSPCLVNVQCVYSTLGPWQINQTLNITPENRQNQMYAVCLSISSVLVLSKSNTYVKSNLNNRKFRCMCMITCMSGKTPCSQQLFLHICQTFVLWACQFYWLKLGTIYLNTVGVCPSSVLQQLSCKAKCGKWHNWEYGKQLLCSCLERSREMEFISEDSTVKAS